MTSPAQIAANRANAQRSTGPRSTAGKAASGRNALKHGLTAERATLRCEDRAAHARLRADLAARYQPQGEAEARAVDDLAFHFLRLARLPLAEAGAWNAFWQEDVWPTQPAFGQVVEGLAHETIGFGAAVKNGVADALCRLSLYEQRIRRAIEKARAQLEALQQARRAAEAEFYGLPDAADRRAEAEALLTGLAAAEPPPDEAPDAPPAESADAAEPNPESPAPAAAPPEPREAPQAESEGASQRASLNACRPEPARPRAAAALPPPPPGPDAPLAEIGAWAARARAHVEGCFAAAESRSGSGA